VKHEQASIPEHRLRARARGVASDLLAFLDDSPCNLFAVAALERRLRDAGFVQIDEALPFEVKPGKPYYLKRNRTALVAFIVGTEAPSHAGFGMVGPNTYSPGFRIKPSPETVAHGVVWLGVEAYGGPIVASWMDRDLGLCGEVHLIGEDGAVESRLFRSKNPIVCLPNVAIHQNRKANDDGLKLNLQSEFTPILGTLAEGLPEEEAVRALVADALEVDVDRILDFDLFLYDTQKGTFAGLNREFVLSGRQDDLAMCHAAVAALIDGVDTPVDATRVAVCYDSEEVGSQTPQGARSTLLPTTLERICLALDDDREGYLAALASSFLVSADNAHGIHPGYTKKMEPNHAPVLNGGPVIKLHASRAYATDGFTASVFALACREAGVPSQRFVNRSDVKSGGTIGSMAAAQLGVRTVDVGVAQYAMHSVREMSGTWDHWYMTRALSAYYLGAGWVAVDNDAE